MAKSTSAVNKQQRKRTAVLDECHMGHKNSDPTTRTNSHLPVPVTLWLQAT